MSFYPSRKLVDLDKEQFFTPRRVADDCVEEYFRVVGESVALSSKWLEPSAGSGVFVDSLVSHGVPLENIVAFDLYPLHPHVKKGDFFNVVDDLQYDDYLTIGNPPFGIRNSICLPFFNAAARKSSHIGFVVPRGWRIPLFENKVDLDFSLVSDKFELGKTFELPDGSSKIVVETIFQVWSRGERRDLSFIEDRGYFEIVGEGEPFDAVVGGFRFHEKPDKNTTQIKFVSPIVKDAFNSVRTDIMKTINRSYTTACHLQLFWIRMFLNDYFDKNPREKELVDFVIKSKKSKSLFDLV